MKRSAINHAYSRASAFFSTNGWALLPHFKWDITDFGLADFEHYGLVLINLAEEKEYCEKLMYAEAGQRTPAHFHKKKKEDIICRTGELYMQVWCHHGRHDTQTEFGLKVNGEYQTVTSGIVLRLQAGERVTLEPGIWHEFWPVSAQCIIGEVSTANDDAHDNYFDNPDIGRFPQVEEDEQPIVKLVSDN
jgi:D-lyxose ketol-isomerase